MRIAVLGPLEVLANDSAPVAVPGAEERLLLAVLAAGAPEPVSADRLIEALWNGDPPDGALQTLRVHLRCLRAALEPGLPERSSGQYVLRRGAGYVLAVGHGDVDARRFTDLAARGRAEVAAGRPVAGDRAGPLARDALRRLGRRRLRPGGAGTPDRDPRRCRGATAGRPGSRAREHRAGGAAGAGAVMASPVAGGGAAG